MFTILHWRGYFSFIFYSHFFFVVLEFFIFGSGRSLLTSVFFRDHYSSCIFLSICYITYLSGADLFSVVYILLGISSSLAFISCLSFSSIVSTLSLLFLLSCCLSIFVLFLRSLNRSLFVIHSLFHLSFLYLQTDFIIHIFLHSPWSSSYKSSLSFM